MKNQNLKTILDFQKNEITEYFIYSKLSKSIKNSENSSVLATIASDEQRHYEVLKKITNQEVSPNKFKIIVFYLICKIFGLTFGIKLMERGEKGANPAYLESAKEYPQLTKLAKDEEIHERKLINLINEDRLKYTGSIVLGLNDALVELTGALAGLSFAFRDNIKLIALSGIVTGIAASLSMASSEYLSAKSDKQEDALKSSIYTGVAYIITVVILVLPYILLSNSLVALGIMIASALLIIFVFNFYISVAREEKFIKKFLEMAIISVSVSTISFLIGILVKQFLGVDL